MRFVAVLAVVACAFVAPATASAADYVAMGDSYSSGTGTREYYEGCERSRFAYPYLMQGSFGTFSFVACGGARTSNVLSSQVGALSTDTEYVTISIGGNDAGFSNVITACAQPAVPFTSGCNPDIDAAQSYINNTLPGRLDLVYDEIRERAPRAVVAVIGYPRLFNGEDCNALTFFSGDEMNRLNQTADQLASVTRARAQAHGFTFVDAREAFRNHAVCDDQEWLNGLSNPVGESYHPNRTGHSAGYRPISQIALQAAPKPDAPNGGNGRIAFASTRDGNSEVYVINSNGQFPVNLTEHASSDIDPAWSPDGTKVAFASDRDGDNEIYVMNGDGSGVTKLTSNTSDDREPAWSPNGAFIAFRSNRTGNNEVFRMTATGGSQTNITNNSASDFAPDWSPDGSEVAYQRFTSGSSTGQGNEVFKANADGQGHQNLTSNSSGTNDGKPAWAPNGGSIAFHSNRDGNFEIYTMTWSGTSETRRTTHSSSDQDPAYSPSGGSIAYQSNRDGNDEIYSMTSTGGSQTRRTTASGSDTAPSWQADSTPPRTTIAGPTGPVGNAGIEFQLASSELGSTFQCRIDGGAFSPCSSPYRPAGLSDGEHTLTVRSIDPTNNVDPAPAQYTFIVDTTKPVIELTCPPSALLNSDASATVVARDATLGQVDDPTGDHRLDTSEPGRQRFTVQAIDEAGNIATAECSYDVVYAAPGKPGLENGESPNAGDFAIGWGAAAPESYGLTYVLERRDAAGGDWQEVDSDIDSTSFAFERGDAADEGTWRYRVRGVDGARSLETPASEASEPVKVDQSAPAKPSIEPDREPEYAGDGGWFRDSVEVRTSDNGDPDLRDGSEPSGVDPASVAAPQTLGESGDVTRTVRDRVGNESASATRSFQVDGDAPELELDCPTSAPLLSDASASVSASDGGSGLADDPSGTVAIDTDSVGTKVIERTATDNVGHATTERCEVRVFYLDPGAPAVTAGGNPNAGDFEIGWQRSAPASYPVRYVLERRAAGDDEWQPVAGDIDAATYTFARGDQADEGTWHYRVKGVDEENDAETGWSAASDPVVVDQTAPAAPTITADRAPEYAGDGGWFRDSVTATTTDNGDPDLRDGSDPSGVDPASIAAPRKLEESGTVRRTVRDRVGNESAESSLALQVDAARPSLALDCPTDVVLGGDAVVETTASDAHSGLADDPSGTTEVDTSRVGTQVFERTAVDNVGHSRTERCEVLVRYDYGGLEEPIDPSGPNVFNQGSTIPLKLALTDAAGDPVGGAEVKVHMERLSSEGEVVDVVEGTATNGKPFTYSAERYRFNLSTKPLAAGDWRIRITLDDGTAHRTAITLR